MHSRTVTTGSLPTDGTLTHRRRNDARQVARVGLVYAKGGDYTPQMLTETPVVQAIGGEIAILDYIPEHSTTGLVNRIKSQQTAKG